MPHAFLSVVAVINKAAVNRTCHNIPIGGFDDIKMASVTISPLTMVRIPFMEIGVPSAGKIDALMEGGEITSETHLAATNAERDSAIDMQRRPHRFEKWCGRRPPKCGSSRRAGTLRRRGRPGASIRVRCMACGRSPICKSGSLEQPGCRNSYRCQQRDAGGSRQSRATHSAPRQPCPPTRHHR